MLVFNSFIWIPSFIFAADLGHFKCFRNSCLQLDVFSDESLEFFQNRFFCRTSHSCCDRTTFTNSENILFRESIYKRFGFQLYYKNASITCCPNNLAKLLTLSWHGLRYESVKIRCIKHLRMITFGVVQAGWRNVATLIFFFWCNPSKYLHGLDFDISGDVSIDIIQISLRWQNRQFLKLLFQMLCHISVWWYKSNLTQIQLIKQIGFMLLVVFPNK